MPTNRYEVLIAVGLNTKDVQTGSRDLSRLLDQMAGRQLQRTRQLSGDELREVQKFNREKGRAFETSARDAARNYERQLGAGFFSRLARDATSAFRNNFSIGGIGGAGGGGLGGLVSGALSVAGGNFITSILGGVKDKITGAIQTGFDFNRIKEQTLLGFEIKLKGKEEAEKFFERVNKFTVDVGGQLPDTLSSVQRLMTAFTAPQALQSLSAITDAIAAQGKVGGEAKESIDSVGLALNQIIYKNKLQAEEVLQLNERQINAWRYLADEIARTDQSFAALTDAERTAKVQELAQKGLLDARASVAAIIRGMEREFGGTAARIASQTLSGLESQTANRLSSLAGTATESAFERYKQVTRATLGSLNSETGDALAKGIRDTSGSLFGAIDSAFDALKTGNLKQLGFGAVESLATGAAEAKDKAVSVFSGVAQEAEQAVRDVWQQNSPSQLFYGLGLGAMTSLAQGLQDGARQVRGFKPEIEKLIEENAQRTGLPANLLRAVIYQESRGNQNAVSPVGARGLMQLMPATARGLGVTNSFDPAQNIRGGADYLKQQLDRFGDLALALAAYNSGPARVAKLGRVPRIAETQDYVAKITADYQRREALPGATGGSYQGRFGASGRTVEQPEPPYREVFNRPAQGVPVPVVVVGGRGEWQKIFGRPPEGFVPDTFREGKIEGFGDSATTRRNVFSRPPEGLFPGGFREGKIEGFDPREYGNEIVTVTARIEDLVATSHELGKALTVKELEPLPGALTKAAEVATKAEDAFANLPPLIKQSGEAAKEAEQEFARIAQDIAGLFGSSLETLLTQGPRDAFRSIRQDFFGMLVGLSRDYFQSSIFKALSGQGTNAAGNGTGGGGIFGSLINGVKNLFGGRGTGRSGNAVGNLLDLSKLPPDPLPPISASARASGAASVATTAANNASGLASLFKGGKFNFDALKSGIGAASPLLGLSLGSQVSGLLGGLGGLLLGGSAAAVLAPSLITGLLGGTAAGTTAIGGSIAASGLGGAAIGLLSNPFTIAAGAGLLLAGVVISRNKARRRDEQQRTQILLASRSSIQQIIDRVSRDQLSGAEALSSAEQVRSDYLQQVGQLRDSKTRRIAEQTVREIDALINGPLKRAISAQNARRSITEQLRPTFWMGGAVSRLMASGGAARYNPLGYVTGPGTARSDSVSAYFPIAHQHARISNTEYVLDAETTRNITVPRLDAIRARKGRGFADGGAVQLQPPAVAQSPNLSNLILHVNMAVTVGMETGVQVLNAALEMPDGQRRVVNTVRADIRANPSGIPNDLQRQRR